jgi:serine/threonine protein kinase
MKIETGTKLGKYETLPLIGEGGMGKVYKAHDSRLDVSLDGQRFLIGTLVGDSKAQPPTVILDWTANLKK